MNLEERIEAFSELGKVMLHAVEGERDERGKKLSSLIDMQQYSNPWFTPENIKISLRSIGEKLTRENLEKWTGRYPAMKENKNPLTAGVIMAGNIPLVGFHDLLSVLISGNILHAKTSSKDPDLIVETGNILCAIYNRFHDYLEFTNGVLEGFDVVIATGSDNSSRYFEYYFGKYPHIIRRHRNSIAVIEGDESEEELEKLGNDIFPYFGLGCRNVSKILVPGGYDFTKMVSSWHSWSGITGHSKYANNYDYSKAVYTVNREKFLDSGFILLKEDKGLSSPVGVIYFEYYDSPEKVSEYIDFNKDKIQCITGRKYLHFGTAQSPELWDFPDNADTLDFLLKKNSAGIL